jgi:mono/diheme cytochrome c family protein
MTNTSFARPAAAVLAALAFAACGGNGGGSSAPASAPAPAPAAAAPAPAAASNTMRPSSGGLPAGVTVLMVAEGDSIYHARNCKNCHGPDAKGAKNGPSLAGPTYLQIDGSYNDIIRIITSGVPADKIKDASHTVPMRAYGGGTAPMINDTQVRSVAAYVYALAHK